MIEHTECTGNLFNARLSGQITKEDIKSVTPIIEKMIVEHKDVKCLVQLNDVTGYTIGGFFADLMLYFKYKQAFKYIAIVSNNEKFKKTTEKLSKFFSYTAKYFNTSELEDAKIWINQF